VRRVLRVKFNLGLMGPTRAERGDPAVVGIANHLAQPHVMGLDELAAGKLLWAIRVV
jgi:hypothetical protein